MANIATFYNAKASVRGLSLFLDIDSKREIIREFHYEGEREAEFALEFEELKHLTLGKTLEELKSLLRQDLTQETKLPQGKKAISSLGLFLLRESISHYQGEVRTLKEERDFICLCFGVTKRDIVREVLANNQFELKDLIAETRASSACGSCRESILKIIDETRSSHGLIKGLTHSKSRYDKEGKWVKVAGLYPGPLLIKLDELKNEWMEREGIQNQYSLEFVDIEGFHLTVKIAPHTPKTTEALLSALSDFLRSRLGVLFFLQGL